jgi:hypothetical protein
MALDKIDLELIERILYKNGDDIAVSIARSFERLEERMDAMESRVYSRIADLETATEGARQDVIDAVKEIPELVRADVDDGK